MVPDPQSPENSAPEDDSTQYVSPPAKSTQRSAATDSSPTVSEATSNSDSDFALSEEVTLGEFRLLRRLGRGGMSEVYLAEQTLLRRHVAIKVLRPELMLDEHLRARFQKEALAVAGLNHPNIVQVYTVGEAEGRFYIAQEYVNGQNLREYLTRKGPPDLPVAVHIMKQVAAALHAAAQAGIVHRDIKPENIMLARKGEVKVADFGLAKRSHSPESQQLTQIGTTMGTPLYMSPEQVNGNDVDYRSDLYSFGITCYHMLAGQPPFRGDNAISIAVQHLKANPKPLEKIRPDLPPLLCRVVHKLMEKNPDERYQTAASVIKELKRVAQEKHQGANARPMDDRPESAEIGLGLGTRLVQAVRNPARYLVKLVDMPLRRQALRLAILCLLVGGICAGIGWARRPENPLIAATKGPGRPTASSVPEKSNPGDQYFLATLRRNDPAAWEAVITRFPDDKVYTPQAIIELAMLNVRENRLAEAQQYVDKLISYGELHPNWQAAGWLGQALIYYQQGDWGKSQQLLTDKGDELRQHLPNKLRQLAMTTIESNATHLRQTVDEQMKKIFEDR